jgi:hypothetical protein
MKPNALRLKLPMAILTVAAVVAIRRDLSRVSASDARGDY